MASPDQQQPNSHQGDDQDDLREQVAALSEEDACFELLECARYGDVDVVRVILDCFPTLQDHPACMDESKSTPLHKASANGHASTAKLLMERGARFVKNESGNTSLHWASSNGHHEVVAALLEHFKEIDVLEKNDFGRSSLTEGFGSKSTDTARLLLEHDSATEERLLQGAQEVDADEEMEDADERKKASVIHDFAFLSDVPSSIVKIRELPITDDPFGNAPVDDTTGFGIWCASLVMARWMASVGGKSDNKFKGKTVVELGAGCGVPGLALARHGAPKHLIVTDLNPTTVENLQYNVDLNEMTNMASASTIDWDDESTWPSSMSSPHEVDVVIGSDLIYQKSIVPLLKKVVLGLLRRNGGSFFYVAPDTGRDGLDQFLEEIQSEGMTLVSKTVAPQEYYLNPLASQDDEECFLHFHELASSTYILYEFQTS
jgi:predicted nicotinamide N-methyase